MTYADVVMWMWVVALLGTLVALTLAWRGLMRTDVGLAHLRQELGGLDAVTALGPSSTTPPGPAPASGSGSTPASPSAEHPPDEGGTPPPVGTQAFGRLGPCSTSAAGR